MLSLDGVAKEYNLKPVLDNITFSFIPGASYALTAPNGSGKTTLLQIMAGLAHPTRGSVLWDGARLNAGTRAKIGVVFQQPFFYGNLTGTENLAFYASLYGCRDPGQVAADWLKRIGMPHAGRVKVREYSKGMRQRLSLARALLHRPQLLLLDEPFDGLDSKSVCLFSDLIYARKAEGSTIVLVTHHASEAEPQDIQLTIRRGRLVNLA